MGKLIQRLDLDNQQLNLVGDNLNITKGNTITLPFSNFYLASNPNGYLSSVSFSQILSKPTTIAGYGITDALSLSLASSIYAPINNPTFTGTISGITKSMVGLSMIDNTSDLNKPVSTATQNSLNLKENLSNKSTDVNLGTSNVLYPTQNAVKTYIDNINLSSTNVIKHIVKAGENLNKGQAVYISSADGTNMIVTKASNVLEVASSKTLGLITQTLNNNEQGEVIAEGLLSGLNTSTAVIGDLVWLGTNGNLIYGLTNKPYAPAHLVFIGIVTRVSSTVGEIFVKVQNGFELNEIHDVDLKTITPVNGDILSYNGTVWVNKSITNLGGQSQLNGTGFIKATGTTINYDNNTYLTTSSASSTYFPLLGGTLTGTAGNGFMGFSSQSSSPSTPSTGFKLYANSSNALSWVGSNGFTRTFDGTSNTGDRTYILPNASGTIALTSDIITGGVTWGNITGTISNQTDLNTALGLKANITTPTFTTSATVPLILGGTTGTSAISIQPTSGTGTTGADISLKVGTNGSTTALQVKNSGNVLINTTTDAGYKFDVNGTSRLNGNARVANSVFDWIGSALTIGSTVLNDAARAVVANGSSYQDILFANTSIASGSINNWSFGQRRDTYFGNSLGSFQIIGGYISNTGVGSTVGGGFRVPLICNPNGDVILAGASANAINGNVGIGTTTPTEKLEVIGNFKLSTAGNKILIATGSNASTGTATLVAGTVTVSTTAVKSGSLVWVQYHGSAGMATSVLTVSTITDSTSFVITAITAGATTTNVTDSNVVKWWIIN